MSLQVVAKRYFEVERREYQAKTVITFNDEHVGGWVVKRGLADADPVAVAAAVAAGSAQVVHTAGAALNRRPIFAENLPDGSPSVTGDSGAVRVSASSIANASKMRKFLAALTQSSVRRVNVLVHSHSIGAGVDATGEAVFGAAQWAAWAARSQYAHAAKILGAHYGGTTCTAGISFGGTGGVPNPLVTWANGAQAPAPDALFGPGSWRAPLTQAAHTLSFACVGSSIRVYAAASGAPSTAQARWSAPSVAGGAIQVVAVPDVAPTPENNRTWYDITINGLTPGETVTLYGSTIAGTSYAPYYIDLDYRPAAAGLTMHRLCQPGQSLVGLHAAAMDSTDTAGINAWLGAGKAAMRLGQAQSMSVRVPSDGFVLQTDVNDLNNHANYGHSLADLQRHLSNYLAYHASLDRQGLVVVGPIRDPAFQVGNRPYNQTDLIAAYREVVLASSNAGFLDLTDEWHGDSLTARYQQQVAAGLMETSGLVHPGAQGHPYWGARIANALIQAAHAGR